MITSIIAGVAKDLLSLADGGSFFEETEKVREARVEKVLTAVYPKSLRAYVTTVSASRFADDIQRALPLFATGSIMTYGWEARRNGFLKACAQALKEVWVSGEVVKGTEFGGAIAEGLKHRGVTRAARVAERELQQFIELVLKEDSPQVQIAIASEDLPYEKLQEWYGGIPSFRVNTQLLGGSRLFMKGKLIDTSWHAKVQSFLSALK